MNPGTVFSPASLLNPRGKQKQKNNLSNGRSKPATPSTPTSDSQPVFTFQSRGNDITPEFSFTSANDDEDDHQIVGQSKLLERSHNLEDRSSKRQKITHDKNDTKTWSGTKSTSEVSEHLKKKRAEGIAALAAESSKPNHNTIDLTQPAESSESAHDNVDLTRDEPSEEEEIDDESSEDEQRDANEEPSEMVAEPKDDPNEEVCIGQIDGASIMMDKVPAVPKNSKSLSKDAWPAFFIKLKKANPRDLRITAYDHNDVDFGTLDAKYAYPISQALAGKKITRLKTLLLNRKRKDGEQVGHNVSLKVPVHLLVFCAKSMAVRLYNQLAKGRAPLRTPVGSEEYIAKLNYYDVEALQFEDSSADILAGAKVDHEALQKIQHDVFKILENVSEHSDLPMKEQDEAIIATPLLDYQKQGLYFMAEQEIEGLDLLNENDPDTNNAAGRSLWRTRVDARGKIGYLNRATGHVQQEAPVQVLGGLLADEMGLGKTLTVISLIASDIIAADDWATSETTPKKYFGSSVPLCNVRTTLVIAPTTVLQNWEEQLGKHVKDNGLTTLKYHGQNRHVDLELLTDYDVILTSYGTVAREMGWRTDRDRRYKSLFSQFNFWRIVLDEAHYIKGDGTGRQRAIVDLQGERRWAITGTPIQNGLEDFGSVLKFLRLSPFDRSFKQLVTLPAKRDPEVVLGRMRLVFDSITLRRTKEKLTLPSNHKHTHRIVLRDDEQLIYDRFTREVQRSIDDVLPDQLNKNYMNFFSQLMSCRRMCDSVDLLSDKEKARINDVHAAADAADAEEAGIDVVHELTEEDGYRQLDALHSCMAAYCSKCGNDILKNPLEGEAENQEIAHFWDCQCFICPSCSEEFGKIVNQIQINHRFTCPEHDVEARVKSVKLTYGGFIKFRQAQARQEEEGSNKVVQRYTKASSKTEALLEYLEIERQHPGNSGMPNKAVIFTGWSNYLDLLQIDLDARGFRYVRLDGSMSQTKRVRNLALFNEDPAITCLVSTIGVGGTGLNLQVANSVFIMEPQWNPAAEEQAVDRVHRLGQTRDVKTIRFMTEDTVEVGVRKLALQKQRLAELTTTKGKLTRADATSKVQELLSVLVRR